MRSISRRFPGIAVTGLDPDLDALAIARGKLAADGLRGELVPGRAEALPFEAESFDLVVSSLMLHHLPTATKRRALSEWRRVVAPGGSLVLFDLGVPRNALLRVILWPLRFRVLEEQADNFRGLVPELVRQARFEVAEAAVYGGGVYAGIARPTT
jgi:demethylmenaquinone methyltransferase/2-methoxy-6-polyprenyl-1,4-benzoquinol methylase/phosphoethanolamine N-methyltransferase